MHKRLVPGMPLLPLLARSLVLRGHGMDGGAEGCLGQADDRDAELGVGVCTYDCSHTS